MLEEEGTVEVIYFDEGDTILEDREQQEDKA